MISYSTLEPLSNEEASFASGLTYDLLPGRLPAC